MGLAVARCGRRVSQTANNDGSDVKSLMKARGEAIAAIFAEDDAAGDEFSEICGPHVDYIWNIQLEGS